MRLRVVTPKVSLQRSWITPVRNWKSAGVFILRDTDSSTISRSCRISVSLGFIQDFLDAQNYKIQATGSGPNWSEQ